YRMSSAIKSRNPVISDPETAAAFFHSIMEKVHDKETFAVAFLNTRNRVIDYDIVSLGSVNSSIVHPREVFRNAVVNKANAVIFCHNHPSGSLSPSQEDIEATNRLKEAGRLLGISVVDHVIINGINKDDAYSFKQNSLMEETATYTTDTQTATLVTRYKTAKEKMQEITDRLEQGIRDVFDSERYKAYLQTMSRFHRYSVNNTILIALQRPDATLVASFNKWRDQFVRNVKKGERGIRIIAPSPYTVKRQVEKMDPRTRQPLKDASGAVLTEEQEVTIPMFRVVSVFDVAQTEGKPLPQIAKPLDGDVDRYSLLLEALQKASPVPICFADLKDNTDGVFSQDKQLITIRAGMSEAQTVSAVIHEIAHARLHNRQRAADRGSEQIAENRQLDRRTKEVEAESVSYAVCSHFDIETGENSFGYIAAWSENKELPELKASLERINSTSAELIDDVNGHLEALEKEPAHVMAEGSGSLYADNQNKINLADPSIPDGTFQIYQLKAEPELKYHRFASMKKLEHMGQAVRGENYADVYQGVISPAEQATDNLNTIYEKFNLDRPTDFTGYSLSVSDVIVLKHQGQAKAYFVDDYGFKELPGFLDQVQKAQDKPAMSQYATKRQRKQESRVSLKMQLRESDHADRSEKSLEMKKIDRPER
ncbi:MAG: hypothetical protein GX862_11910, partial [Leucobacter sp.]|nr:hypothetical protein [Leucobacter sp.]